MIRPAFRALAAAATFAAVLARGAPALAYRPFDGTDADVAAHGDFELELGPVHYYAFAGNHYLIAPATVLNLGFAPGWEAVVDFQNFVGLDGVPGQPRDQLLETDALVKAVLLDGSLQDAGPWPSIALEFGPLLPNVNGEEGFGASADLIVSERWRYFAFHLNSWFQLTRGDWNPDWFEGVILEGPFEAPIRPVAETFVEHEWGAGDTTVSGLVGAIWRAHEGLDIDVGFREARVWGDGGNTTAGLGGTEDANTGPNTGQWITEVRLGLTWTIGVWEPVNEQKRGGAPLRTAFAR